MKNTRRSVQDQIDEAVEAYGPTPTMDTARAAWVAVDCARGSGASPATIRVATAVAQRVTAMVLQNRA